MKPELVGYGPKLVDDDYKKTHLRPWVEDVRTPHGRYQTEHMISLGPRYPAQSLMKADPEKTVRIHDVVLDTWRRRHQDGQSQAARGSEREVLSNWRDKQMLPNDALPPIKPQNAANWRTQYTKDFSAANRTLNKTTRLSPDEGNLDKVTKKQEYSVVGKLKPFMADQMAAQYRPDAYNKFGQIKTRSQIVFG